MATPKHTPDLVEVTTQQQLDQAVADGNIPVCRRGFFAAFGQATVRASKFVAVHRNGDTAKVNGGVLIQIPPLDTPADWLDYYGVEHDDTAVLFKAVDGDYRSRHGATYTPGSMVECDDWDSVPACVGGLHLCARPFMAARYQENAKRFLACRVKVSDVVVIDNDSGTADKVKVPRLEVLFEVDEDGERVEADRKVVA
ncbi:MAG TPA: hypothetical protein VFJ21_13920 [Mycobacteriales bacterium]|nr:hypothetical protein [Mycobacteriales bacterium]